MSGSDCSPQRQYLPYSPFNSCNFALPSHRRQELIAVRFPVFFNKPSSVASSFSQTRVWSDCQPAKAHLLQHTPHPCAPFALQPPSWLAHSHSKKLWTFEWSSPPVSPPLPPQLSTLSYDFPSSITQSNVIAHVRGNWPYLYQRSPNESIFTPSQQQCSKTAVTPSLLC